ncbi:MAG: ABC transporter substrate-binding protein [Proteobacteria bacterium]|nr:ABC transporter substrate-binding protein [Pseudomonadota bacterium]
MIRKWILWSLFAIFAVFCIVWLTMLVVSAVKNDSMRRGVKELRTERAAKSTGPIYIGAAGGWDSIYKPILDGITMAADEINKSGGVLGRPIIIVPKNDNSSIVTGMKMAQELSENIDVVAVIGHPNSPVSIAVSSIYEYYGLLMLSPLSSNPKLTRLGHKLVFRNIPTDVSVGEQLAQFAARKGYKKVAIYYLQEDYARELANIFEQRSGELGISIVDRLPYDATYKSQNFSNDFSLWKKQFKPDAILLAGLLPQAAECIIQIRKAGFDIPILSGLSLDNETLISSAGRDAENTIVASSFDSDANRPEVAIFKKAYQAKYGVAPNRYAAQGYDATRLLAHVMQKGGSTVPAKMAETLRSIKDWQGVTGSHTFNKLGDVEGKPLLMKVVKNGRFQVIELPGAAAK